MGTFLGPKYIPNTYMDPLGLACLIRKFLKMMASGLLGMKKDCNIMCTII